MLSFTKQIVENSTRCVWWDFEKSKCEKYLFVSYAESCCEKTTLQHSLQANLMFVNLLLFLNPDGWSTAGCSLRGIVNDTIICECDHMTNFAALVVSIHLLTYCDVTALTLPTPRTHKHAIWSIGNVKRSSIHCDPERKSTGKTEA